jgi:hypothetical protein
MQDAVKREVLRTILRLDPAAAGGLSESRAGESAKDRDQRDRQTRDLNASAHEWLPWRCSGARTSRNHQSDIPDSSPFDLILRVGEGAGARTSACQKYRAFYKIILLTLIQVHNT